jgi:hypothetical protein
VTKTELKAAEHEGENLGKRMEKLLDQEPDEYLRTVDKLGILGGLEPKETRKMVSGAFPKARQRSIRWFQLRIAATKERLAAALRQDYPSFFKRFDDEKEKKKRKRREERQKPDEDQPDAGG